MSLQNLNSRADATYFHQVNQKGPKGSKDQKENKHGNDATTADRVLYASSEQWTYCVEQVGIELETCSMSKASEQHVTASNDFSANPRAMFNIGLFTYFIGLRE